MMDEEAAIAGVDGTGSGGSGVGGVGNPWTGLDYVERNGTVEGIRIRVHVCSADERVLFFRNVDVTAQQVCAEMARKERIHADARRFFTLWIVGHDLELQLKPKQDLFFVVENFPRYVEKYTHDLPGVLQWRFVYKREALAPRELERKIKDPNAIKLLYHEAVQNVLASRYPCNSISDAFVLAGMAMHVTYGKADPRVHVPGFFSHDTFRRLMPKQFLSQLPRSVLDPTASGGGGSSRADDTFSQWEERILEAHRKHADKPAMIVQLLYLQYVRQWPFYGSTFFVACSRPPPNGYFEKRDETLFVGVNAEGIHVVNMDKMTLFKSFVYDDVYWDCRKDTFLVEFGSLDSLMSMTLITPQSHMIRNLVVRAIKNLNKKDKRLEEIRERQSRQ